MAAVRAHEPLSEEKLRTVHAKVRKASYMSGGQDWAKNARRLFGQYDKDRSGSLGVDELTMAARASLKLNQVDLPDREVAALFAMLDADGSGALEIAEFLAFLARGPALPPRGADPSLARTSCPRPSPSAG